MTTPTTTSVAPTNYGRGIAVWDGPKTNISITDVTAQDNRLVGIDVNDGSVTGVTITGNTVTGNGDSGIGVLGPEGPGANLIADNIVSNNGRYGIEDQECHRQRRVERPRQRGRLGQHGQPHGRRDGSA